MLPPEVRLTSSLSPLSRLWRRAVDQALMRFGLSEAIAAPLVYLGRSGGGLTQVELAALVGIGGPSLVRLLDRLAASGLVDRCVDPNDRRVKRLHLTPEGAGLAEKIEGALNALRAASLAGIPEEDIRTCLSVFERMSEAVTSLEAGMPHGTEAKGAPS